MKPTRKPGLFRRRWRVILAAVVGVAGVSLARSSGFPPGLASLVGWNGACLVFLTTTLWMMWRDDEQTVRARAAYEDQGQAVTMGIVLVAVMASLAATVVAMQEAKAGSVPAAGAPLLAAWIMSVSTLVLGWIVVQTVFTLRYAHRYFGDADDDGAIDRGIKFPGDPPKTYHDFVYVAVCVGATAQVSDVNITTARYRRLVTQHALLAFFYNTMVLALGINILATIIGH
jgi:uncharacterized membrane protein